MTKEHEASRRLVKSPPELWAECSDPSSLARHLGEFGEIKITRVEPETTVAWEGEHARGTVRIEPSGWGTRVTLTALTEAPVAVAEETTAPGDEVPQPQPVEEESDATPQKTLEESDPPVVPDTPRLRGRWWRMRVRMRALVMGPEPEMASSWSAPLTDEAPRDSGPEPQPAMEPPEAPVATEAIAGAEEAAPLPEVDLDPEAVLVAALDSLGQAHHRPFSRA